MEKKKRVSKLMGDLPDVYEFGGAKRVAFDPKDDVIFASAAGSITCARPTGLCGTRLCASSSCT